MKILAIFSGVMVALILASAPPAHAYSHAYSHGSSRLYSYASRATSASHSRSSSKAHRGSHRESHQESHRGAHQESLNKSSHRCFTCKRDRHGHIRRSGKARSAFEHSHPCPATGKTKGRCAGYVVIMSSRWSAEVPTSPAICSGNQNLRPRQKTRPRVGARSSLRRTVSARRASSA